MKLVRLAPTKRRRKKRITGRGKVIITAMALVLLLIGWRVFPVIINSLANVATARTGFIEECWHGEGLVIRDEIVTTAPVGGWLQLQVVQGEHVRVGDVIAVIVDDEGQPLHTLTTQQAGVLSYLVDGMESLQPDQPMTQAWSQLRTLRVDQLNTGDRVEVGEPVYKVIDTLNCQLYVAVQGKQALAVGGQVLVTQGDIQAYMQVRQVEQKGESTLALLCSNHFPAIFNDYRYLSHVSLSRNRHYGIIIPVSSIVTDKKGRTAVYLLVDRRPIYMRVQVIAQNNKEAVVSGIPVGARVARQPRRLWVYSFPW